MSSTACVVFYGIRYEVPAGQTEPLELRTDARMQAARKAGLNYYWGNFGLPGERYLLFVGANLGILGPENSMEVNFRLPDLHAILESTREKIEAAGLAGEPSLHLQWLAEG